MRAYRFVVVLGAMGAQLAAGVAGCGDSDTNGGGSSPAPAEDGAVSPGADTGSPTSTDGSTVVDGTVADVASPPVITVVASDLNVYLGQQALVDGSGSSVVPAAPSTYKWTVESAPAGSAVVSAALFNAGSAKPSFAPDKVGDYVLKLVITAGGVSGEKIVTVKAFEAQAFFLYSEDAGAGGALYRGGVRAAATITDAGVKNLSCNLYDGGSLDTTALTSSYLSSDYWEAPPGGESKVVYAGIARGGDAGGDVSRLFFVGANATCSQAPFKLDEATSGDTFLHPQFSPNGQRIAYVLRQASGDRVITIAPDATQRKVLAPYVARADGGAVGDASVSLFSYTDTSIDWVNDTQVGWVQLLGGNAWRIVVASDQDGATPAVHMTCKSVGLQGDGGAVPDTRPIQFAFLPGGDVLVAVRTAMNDAGKPGARDLVVMRPDPTTKACSVVRNLTNLPPADGGPLAALVGDFALSPDGTQVAFTRGEPGFDAGAGVSNMAIWQLSVDGLTPPSPYPGAPDRGVPQYGSSHMTVGPRWVAGGAMLVWPQQAVTVDAGDSGATAMVISSPLGGAPRVLLKPVNGKSQFGIGNGASSGTFCTIGTAGASGVAAFGSFAALVGLVLRRRRNNR
ncbi:MAG: PD40 domain-containing protein [Myxococcales bacterium]|nr:PD40 domain-containing protein [Myxococcales bacterium]